MSESQVDGVLRPETPPEDQKVLAESLLTPSRQPGDEPSTDVVNWLHLLYLGFVANIGHLLFRLFIFLFIYLSVCYIRNVSIWF